MVVSGMEAAMLLGARRFLQLYFGSGVLSALWYVTNIIINNLLTQPCHDLGSEVNSSDTP